MEMEKDAVAIVCQDNKYLVKCPCGWEGYEWQMKHGYVPLFPDDVTPMLKCPVCGRQEDMCEWHEIDKCKNCGTRLSHFGGLEQIPEYLYCPLCNDVAYDFDGEELFGLI